MDPAERQMQFVFALRSHGVTNPAVLDAMEHTPREAFLEGIQPTVGPVIELDRLVCPLTHCEELEHRWRIAEGTDTFEKSIFASVKAVEAGKLTDDGLRRKIAPGGSDPDVLVAVSHCREF